MTTRLVTIIGMGPGKTAPYYEETVYMWAGRQSRSTPLVDRAICELLNPSSIVVLGTEEVKKRWILSGLLEQHLDRPYAFRTVPAGRTDIERWEMFSAFNAALTLEAARDAGETEAPDTFIIDITHGFRIQPVFLMSALAFSFSEWARQGVSPPTVRIVYGAFDAREANGGAVPIWDLTEFLTVSRWNAALDAFLRYGRADDLGVLADSASKDARREQDQTADLKVHEFLKKFGAKARDVADDLALARTCDLMTKSVPKFLEMLDDPNCQIWLTRLPVLRGAVNLLKLRLAPLTATSTVDKRGLQAMAALSDLYLVLQRFSEAAVTIREGLITHYALQFPDLLQHLREPKSRGCHSGRLAIEGPWNADVKLKVEGRPDPNWRAPVLENARLTSAFQQTRNDIEHGGFNDMPTPSRRLRERLTSASEAFGNLVDDLPAPPSASTPPDRFVNLSNHPLSTWTSAQLGSARSLGHGEPVDLSPPLPHVTPEADIDDVLDLASGIVDRVMGSGASAAFVSTEPTLTVALVSELQRRGVECYTTTSRREAAERVLSDGVIEKTSRFEFVSWRKYPRI